MSGEEAKAMEPESVKPHDQTENNSNEKAASAEKPGTTEFNVDEAEAKLDKQEDERSAKDQRGN
jgi:hypothetical protein